MDNLTHSLTGLVLTRAGLLVMLAANMPDVDVVLGSKRGRGIRKPVFA